jgi:predicted transglutaminase-like protease
MGYLPIILTLGSFIVLFALIFNQSLNQKKRLLKSLQQQVKQGLIASGIAITEGSDLSSSGQKNFEAAYTAWKTLQESPLSAEKENNIKKPYLQYKLELVRFNKLIVKKPYSLVAGIMGHHQIKA